MHCIALHCVAYPSYSYLANRFLIISTLIRCRLVRSLQMWVLSSPSPLTSHDFVAASTLEITGRCQTLSGGVEDITMHGSRILHLTTTSCFTAHLMLEIDDGTAPAIHELSQCNSGLQRTSTPQAVPALQEL